MTLHQKILALYPELQSTDKVDLFADRTIVLQDDLDGRGAYIARWDHPTLPRATQEQLDAGKE